MRERIERYAKNVVRAGSTGPGRNGRADSKEAREESELRGLWESVKGSGRREAVVLRVLDDGEVAATKTESRPLTELDSAHPALYTEIVSPQTSTHAKLLARLEVQIAKISHRRDELKAEEEIVGWREAIINYAARRADRRGECGWDGRLLWSEDEVQEYGAEVIDAYERVEIRLDGMVIDDVEEVPDEGEWWCADRKSVV